MLGLIDNLGFGEFMIVAVVALLVFGKRLPQVAGQAGAHLARFRRSIDTLWRETGVAQEIRSVQKELNDIVPRDLSIGDMARMASADIQKSLREVGQGEPTVPRTPPVNGSVPAATSAPLTASEPAQRTVVEHEATRAHEAEGPPPAIR